MSNFPSASTALAAALALGTSAVAQPAPPVSLPDAVLRTINENPAVKALEQEVADRRGRARTAHGQFDWSAFLRLGGDSDRLAVSNLSQLTRGLTDASLRVQKRELSAGASRQNPSGVVFEPSVTFFDSPDAGALPNVTRSDVRATVYVPLRRGRGRRVVAANQRAARKGLESTELQVAYEISRQVLLTVTAHYNCLAAEQSLALSEDIFSRAEELLSGARKMIGAGILEPAFIHQAQAKLANNQSDLISGRNALYAARQALGLAMGLGPDELLEAPLAGGSFPPVLDPEHLAAVSPTIYLERARENRLDYLARRAATSVEEIQLIRDIDNTRARIDLELRASYAGLGEDFPSSSGRQFDALDRMTGLNTGVFLNFEIPVENNVARGRVDSRRASVQRFQSGAEALLNEISASTLTEAKSVEYAAMRCQLAREAEENSAKAVDFERDKYRSGNSRLNLVIDLEDRYIRARLAVIEAVRRYAVSLARLRFETGSLLRREGDELVFRLEDLHASPETP